MKYLNQTEAINLDQYLFSPECGFSVDQLMELAGHSVAWVVNRHYAGLKTLVVCGPGNNGGDGFVCARHLHFWGHDVTVLAPKEGKGALLEGLRQQMRIMGIPVLATYPEEFQGNPAGFLAQFGVIVDGIFGFSFKPPMRDPFASIIRDLRQCGVPLVSIDIPSGEDVERGNVTGEALQPAVLVSLSAPKLCARNYHGIHYLGGRFIPRCVQERFQLELPPFPSSDPAVRLPS
ncbi:putative apolipoprotein a-i binding protein [Paratrimastix pyriformis]|uniref:NAD(P)H-hydrate epimerase n=1 Tax=Paratrimastix pyriformis TaxID=342808 RepID=A0ABQ8U4B2_9EUKA|nr:putative apolipoprotein a-i binding protein [Paratrimastix pyriformis]